MNTRPGSILIVVLSLLAVAIFAGLFLVGPVYNVWSQTKAGQAELRRAEYSRQIAVAEAQAAKESAVMLADAEIERARGVAEANQIIGDSLAGNDDYLRYLWVQGVQQAGNSVIYIPTEGNLPILEARDER